MPISASCSLLDKGQQTALDATAEAGLMDLLGIEAGELGDRARLWQPVRSGGYGIQAARHAAEGLWLTAWAAELERAAAEQQLPPAICLLASPHPKNCRRLRSPVAQSSALTTGGSS